MKKLIFVVILCIISLYIKAQNNTKIDSLQKILQTLPALKGTDADTTRIKISIEIGTLFENLNIDSALYWCSLVCDTIYNEQKINKYPNWAKQNANAQYNISLYNRYKGLFSVALIYNEKAYRIFNILNDKPRISDCLKNFGIIAGLQDDFSKAILFFEKSLKIREELKDIKGMAECFHNISVCCIKTDDISKGIIYIEKTADIYIKIGDS